MLPLHCLPSLLSWPEIKASLEHGQQANDRPDVIARVFKCRLQQLMHDLTTMDALGKVTASMERVEFQKRSLPHAHILLWLSPQDKPRTTDDYDKLVWAEIPDIRTHPDLHKKVTSYMLHGPCETHGCKNPETGQCRFHFPRNFQENTVISNDGYPLYRRRNIPERSYQKDNFTYDNRWVAPYNPWLLLRHDSHINVEVRPCKSRMACMSCAFQ